MTIAMGVKLEAARTAFLTLGSEAFSGDKQTVSTLFSRKVPCPGTFLEIDSLGVVPAVSEITGSRQYSGLRAYVNRARVKRYGPAALLMPVLDIMQKTPEAIGQALAEYMGIAANFDEKPIQDFLITNPVGIDGVALVHDSHPFAFSGTWDNKTTNALTPDEFKIGIAAMQGLLLENGVPAGYSPRVLMVGPPNRKLGMDLCGNAMRVVPVNASGAEAYASAIAATAIPNTWMAGEIQCVVNPWWIGAYATNWLLIDNSRPANAAVIVGEAIPAAAYAITDPSAASMIEMSKATFYAEAQFALLGGNPMGLYGLLA